MACFRIILENVKGRLFLAKSEGKALLPGFLPVYRMLFKPFRVPCRLESLSAPDLKWFFDSNDTYSWIHFFAVMSNHCAEFFVSSNSS